MKNIQTNSIQNKKDNNKNGLTYLKKILPSLQNRQKSELLNQYQNVAKKAKEQLQEFQARKKNSFKINYACLAIDPAKYNNQLQPNIPRTMKSNGSNKTLSKNYSEKYFKKDSMKMQKKIQPIEVTYQDWQQNKNLSPPQKMYSLNKQTLLNKNDYKKLHDKLDSIENRIINIKQSLQKKKEEKLKMMAPKPIFIQTELEEEVGKLGLQGLVTQMPQHGQVHLFSSNPYSPRHNTYYVSELIRAYQDQRSLAKQHLITSLNILKLLQQSKQLSEDQIKKIRPRLPIKKGYQEKITLIFDLDQTLIHCNETVNPPYDIKLPIKFPTGEVIEAGINIRPYARQILKNLSKHFEIMVFTASHSCYANVVVDFLDPNKDWVHHRLFRQHCFLSAQGMYIKDLRIIDRDMNKMILVDNAAYSYAYQLQNGVPIFPYYHGQIDFELKMLEQYLMTLVSCPNIRQMNNKTFKLTSYNKYFNKPERLVEELYLNK